MTQEEISVRIKEAKQIAIHKQLYEFAARLRDLERKFEKGEDWQKTLNRIIDTISDRVPVDGLADVEDILKSLRIKEIRNNRLGDILGSDK